MEVSRLKLYELVSNSPLSKVAPSFGISATELAAVCREHNVPYPGSGYWTRKSLGQMVELEPLSLSSESGEQLIHIEPAKARTSRADARPADEPAPAQRTSTTAELPIEDRPVKPHAIVTKWITDRERRRREALASRNEWRIRTTPPLSDIDHRKHRILDVLLRSLEAKGAKVSEAEKGLLRVTIDGEKIDFQIREKNKQVRIAPDDRRSSYSSQELVGTGRLVFAIRTYLHGRHNEEWVETDHKPLESQMTAIIDRLFEGAQILKAWHIELAQQEEQRRQLAAQRAERERLAQQEQSRRQKLSELAQDWRTANQIRDLVSAVQSMPFDKGKEVRAKTVGEWILWAETAADALDVLRRGPEGLFEVIGSVDIPRGW